MRECDFHRNNIMSSHTVHDSCVLHAIHSSSHLAFHSISHISPLTKVSFTHISSLNVGIAANALSHKRCMNLSTAQASQHLHDIVLIIGYNSGKNYHLRQHSILVVLLPKKTMEHLKSALQNTHLWLFSVNNVVVLFEFIQPLCTQSMQL